MPPCESLVQMLIFDMYFLIVCSHTFLLVLILMDKMIQSFSGRNDLSPSSFQIYEVDFSLKLTNIGVKNQL